MNANSAVSWKSKSKMEELDEYCQAIFVAPRTVRDHLECHTTRSTKLQRQSSCLVR